MQSAGAALLTLHLPCTEVPMNFTAMGPTFGACPASNGHALSIP
jgi:hypothetical protein